MAIVAITANINTIFFIVSLLSSDFGLYLNFSLCILLSPQSVGEEGRTFFFAWSIPRIPSATESVPPHVTECLYTITTRIH
jgi:hypothetical protein